MLEYARPEPKDWSLEMATQVLGPFLLSVVQWFLTVLWVWSQPTGGARWGLVKDAWCFQPLGGYGMWNSFDAFVWGAMVASVLAAMWCGAPRGLVRACVGAVVVLGLWQCTALVATAFPSGDFHLMAVIVLVVGQVMVMLCSLLATPIVRRWLVVLGVLQIVWLAWLGTGFVMADATRGVVTAQMAAGGPIVINADGAVARLEWMWVGLWVLTVLGAVAAVTGLMLVGVWGPKVERGAEAR